MFNNYLLAGGIISWRKVLFLSIGRCWVFVSPLLFAIFGRRQAVFLLKVMSEMAIIGETNLITDLFDLKEAIVVLK